MFHCIKAKMFFTTDMIFFIHWTWKISMSTQIRTQYFGPEFMRAMQIYRRRSIMRQDDMTNQQDDRPSGQDNMTNRQDNRTSRQGSIENRHRVIFDLIPLHRHHLFMLMTQDHPPNIICTSKNLILKNYIVCVCCKTSRPNFYKNYGMRYPWEIQCKKKKCFSEN